MRSIDIMDTGKIHFKSSAFQWFLFKIFICDTIKVIVISNYVLYFETPGICVIVYVCMYVCVCVHVDMLTRF